MQDMISGKLGNEGSRGPTFEAGPYVKAAFFCEKVLREVDGVLTFVRIVDRITVTATGPVAPNEMPPTRYDLSNVVILVAGRALGRHDLTITPELPSGQLQTPVVAISVNFDGRPQSAVNIIGQFTMQFELEGIYWFNVYLDDRLIARMPLSVVYTRVVTTATPPAGAP